MTIRNENTSGAAGLCLEIHDLAVSKLVAGREKDLDFLAGVLRHGLAHAQTIRDRLGSASLSTEQMEICLGRLERLIQSN